MAIGKFPYEFSLGKGKRVLVNSKEKETCFEFEISDGVSVLCQFEWCPKQENYQDTVIKPEQDWSMDMTTAIQKFWLMFND